MLAKELKHKLLQESKDFAIQVQLIKATIMRKYIENFLKIVI